ncbi:MAG: heavy-metal-associated domain-containing protein [Saprospiraceae bacterium]|jgi:copper chaperone CopZ|nr:heavy-metal-associated domain-containing protein [Saprospiraceae bacterium]
MKKNIFLILFAFIGFAFTANAQTCCSSKAKNTSSCAKKTATATKSCCAAKTDETTKACCAKKTSATANTTAGSEAKAVLVSTNSEHNKTEKFTVYGNCGMCKKTIEGSLKDVKGVIEGTWNRETDQMTVTYNPHVLNLSDIKQKIADVGYDSDTHRAKEEVYNSLPGCCQYERPKS